MLLVVLSWALTPLAVDAAPITYTFRGTGTDIDWLVAGEFTLVGFDVDPARDFWADGQPEVGPGSGAAFSTDVSIAPNRMTGMFGPHEFDNTVIVWSLTYAQGADRWCLTGGACSGMGIQISALTDSRTTGLNPPKSHGLFLLPILDAASGNTIVHTARVSIERVPEPATLSLFGTATVGLIAATIRRSQRNRNASRGKNR